VVGTSSVGRKIGASSRTSLLASSGRHLAVTWFKIYINKQPKVVISIVIWKVQVRDMSTLKQLLHFGHPYLVPFGREHFVGGFWKKNKFKSIVILPSYSKQTSHQGFKGSNL
jgi:hypothetical protein